jgi:hypothetical protein
MHHNHLNEVRESGCHDGGRVPHYPKNVTLSQEQRYQNVRIIAVYQTDQVPVVPQAPRG